MKIVRIYCPGVVPSKKNSRITNRKTGRSFPSKRYTAWHKECEQFYKEEFGAFPTEPIRKCYKLELDLVFGDKRKTDNTNKAESIHDFLVDIGVLLDDNWMITGSTVQNPRYEKSMASWEVRLWVDDKNPINELVNWNEFNVDREVDVSPDVRPYVLMKHQIDKVKKVKEAKALEERMK